MSTIRFVIVMTASTILGSASFAVALGLGTRSACAYSQRLCPGAR